MPWKMKKVGSKYQVVRADTGKPQSKKKFSKQAAARYLRALYANTKGER